VTPEKLMKAWEQAAIATVFGLLRGLYADYDRFFRVASRSNMLHRLLVARDVQSTADPW
jgi:hypothetical protein